MKLKSILSALLSVTLAATMLASVAAFAADAVATTEKAPATAATTEKAPATAATTEKAPAAAATTEKAPAAVATTEKAPAVAAPVADVKEDTNAVVTNTVELVRYDKILADTIERQVKTLTKRDGVACTTIVINNPFPGKEVAALYNNENVKVSFYENNTIELLLIKPGDITLYIAPLNVPGKKVIAYPISVK